MVSKDLPVKSLTELVAYAKKNPNTLSYGTTGYGGPNHLAFESFKAAANIPEGDLPQVPFAGIAPAVTALLGGQIQVGLLPLSATMGKQIESGNIRALAVAGPKAFFA